MNRYRILFLLLIAATTLPFNALAQGNNVKYKHEKENDVQFRTGFDFEKKMCKRFSLSWNEELRIKNDFKDIDRIYSGLSGSVKIADWVKMSAAYTFISVYQQKKKSEAHGAWDLRHRLSADITFSYKTYNNWKFSLRERVQTTFLTEDHIDHREKENPDWALKSRVMAEYEFSQIPLSPYTSIELCNTLKVPHYVGHNYLEKVRSAIGTEYKINKRNYIDIFYRFDYNREKKIKVKNSTGELKSFTTAKSYNNIFCVSYKFKF